MSARVMIVGGAGVFGRRLAEGLLASTDADVILAGRSLERVKRVAREVGAPEALSMDRLTVSAVELEAIAPAIVIDAAGPFQGASYAFARTVLEAGAHYIDLADARDFVAGFGVLNDLALRSNRSAVTGASSTPALTHAALDALCRGWRRIDVIKAGIAPGNRAPRGRSLVEAILSRAGAPTRVFQDGVWALRPGWSHVERIQVEGAGHRRFALVETPDLDLIPERFAPTDSAVFMAALELGLLQRGIEVIGALRNFGVWRDPQRWAPLMTLCAKVVEPLGGDRGAMFVEALGRDEDNRPCRARWTLVAPAGRGPYAPTLPALAWTRKLLAGGVAPGARPCVGLLALDDLTGDFARVGISTRIERELLVSPFEKALGRAFEMAPAPVRLAHRGGPVTRLAGAARVTGPGSFPASLVARCIGFPRAAANAPVRVTMRLETGDRETWIRNIGGRLFRSQLTFAAPGMIRERFGAFEFDIAVSVDASALRMEVVGWRLAAIAMPRFLAPRSVSYETDNQGSFRFDVPIALPMLGALTHYVGSLSLLTDGRAKEMDAA